MLAITIASVIAVIAFAAGVMGLVVQKWLPTHVRSDDSRDLIKLVVALVSTMTAMVLGLLIASTYTAYALQKTELDILAARTLQLDQLLAQYGPEAWPGRILIKEAMLRSYQKIWGDGRLAPQSLTPEAPVASLQGLAALLGALEPATDSKKRLLAKASDLAESIGETRILMSLQISARKPFSVLTLLTWWVSVLFFGFGLLSRINPVVLGALAIGSISFGSAILLILVMAQPYSGLARLSPAALEQAIKFIGR